MVVLSTPTTKQTRMCGFVIPWNPADIRGSNDSERRDVVMSGGNMFQRVRVMSLQDIMFAASF